MLLGVMPMTALATEAEENPWRGRSAVFVGDSITAGSGTTKKYFEYLTQMLELGSVNGMGIGGSCKANGFSCLSVYHQNIKSPCRGGVSPPESEGILISFRLLTNKRTIPSRTSRPCVILSKRGARVELLRVEKNRRVARLFFEQAKARAVRRSGISFGVLLACRMWVTSFIVRF